MTPERSHEWIQLAASRSIDARSAAGDGPPWLRTVGVMETAEGPTLVGAGARDPTIAQKALAESFGPRSHKHAPHEIRSRPPPPSLGTRAVCIVGNHLRHGGVLCRRVRSTDAESLHYGRADSTQQCTAHGGEHRRDRAQHDECWHGGFWE